MAGIYVHIPFCRQKCHYCNFYSIASRKHIDGIAGAIINEAILRKEYLSGEKVTSIYLGGGTPSILTKKDIDHIFKGLHEHFNIGDEAEISLEANPEDLTEEKLIQLRDTPINRFSIGIQSLHDDDLEYLHRIHNGKSALKSIERSLQAGFNNLSIDLIYGIPTLTNEKWAHNIESILNLGIPHISAYSLTVEKKTALDFLINKGKLRNIDDEQAIEHYKVLKEKTEAAGYLQYEISNFALPGKIALHNTAYWKGEKYLGLGPSAHSYNGNERSWNISNVGRYIDGTKQGELLIEREILSNSDRFNEYIMTGLRTMWGIDMEYIAGHFGDKYLKNTLDTASAFIKKEQLIDNGSTLRLSETGKLYADGIASEFFTG